jgi:hypothetical protein
MNEGEEGLDKLGGPDVHRGRIRHVAADDGTKCEDDDDEKNQEQRLLVDDDARRRIITVAQTRQSLIRSLTCSVT